MGTCIDYYFRFGGSDADKVDTALDIIQQTQKATAEHSGNGVCDFSSEPHDDKGFKLWWCFCKSGDPTPDDLCQKLAALTKGGGFRFWFYWECTDGCNESGIEEHCEGDCVAELSWGTAALGLSTAVAAAELVNRPNADAMIELIDYLIAAPRHQMDEEGDDEDEDDDYDDVSALENSFEVAITLVDEFQRWSDLLRDARIRGKFGPLNRRLAVLLRDAKEHLVPDEQTRSYFAKLEGLCAVFEAAMLYDATLRVTNGVASGQKRKSL
jgi:hypothetical protein